MKDKIEPSYKAPQMDSALTYLFGVDRHKTISNGECIACEVTGLIASSFSDDVSRKEYSISGMCQSCQDDLFGADEDDEPDEDWDDESAFTSAGMGMDDSYAHGEDFGYFGEAGLWD